ncbi:hypothetical protein ACU686_24195 [Yinghuangia aomiensis]
MPTAAVAARLGALHGGLRDEPGPWAPDAGPGGPFCPDVAAAHAHLAATGWKSGN